MPLYINIFSEINNSYDMFHLETLNWIKLFFLFLILILLFQLVSLYQSIFRETKSDYFRFKGRWGPRYVIVKSLGYGFGCFAVKWHINFLGLSNVKSIVLEEQQWCYLTHSWRIRGSCLSQIYLSKRKGNSATGFRTRFPQRHPSWTAET